MVILKVWGTIWDWALWDAELRHPSPMRGEDVVRSWMVAYKVLGPKRPVGQL